MQEIESDGFTYFVSDDFVDRHSDDQIVDREGWLEYAFTKRRLYRELIDVWGTLYGLEGCAVLDAHGDTRDTPDDQWFYYENNIPINPVQTWVNELDGSYCALMIVACNPDNIEVYSERSLVFYLDRVLIWPLLVGNRGAVRVYVPGEGFLEKEYKKLKKVIDGCKSKMLDLS